MDKKFVERFNENKGQLEEFFSKEHPVHYGDIVKAVVEAIRGGNEYDSPNPERIHEINDGDYQGTLVYVIGEGGYQPDDYWYVKVYYGSCSGCDTLEAIRGYKDGPPTEDQVEDYMTLALHIVQGLKKMGGDTA